MSKNDAYELKKRYKQIYYISLLKLNLEQDLDYLINLIVI